MLELLQQVGFSAAVAAIIAGSLGFLLRSWIDHGRNIEIEKLRTQLSTIQHEQNTRFSRLHEDQATAIRTIYGLIHDHRSSIATFLNSIHHGFAPSEQEAFLMDVFGKSLALYDFHMKHRILFTTETNALIDKLERQQYDIPKPFFPDINSRYVLVAL